MKKLLLLFLLVAGGVSTVSAWNGPIYLLCDDAGWSDNNDSYKFTKNDTDGNEWYYEVPATKVQNGYFHFVFRHTGDGNSINKVRPATNSDNVEVTSSWLTSVWTNQDDASNSGNNKAFYIAQNANAKKVYIILKYENSSWKLRSLVYTTNDEYTINVVNDNNDWSDIYAYVYKDEIRYKGSWPGTKLTGDAPYELSVTVPEGASVIFNNGSSGSSNETDPYDLVFNGNYNTSGLTGVKANVTAASFATICSTADLDYTSTSIKAYTAEVNTTNGKVTLTKIDKVPANTPVVLYKEGGATEDIPVAGSTDTPGANNLVAGTGAAVYTSEVISETTYYNYILNNVSGIGFYKANGQTVASNRAYLHTTFNVDPGSGARMTMVFADETTGIKDVNTTSNNRYFDLQGRSVAQPTKGLYIVNGKKVIKK